MDIYVIKKKENLITFYYYWLYIFSNTVNK